MTTVLPTAEPGAVGGLPARLLRLEAVVLVVVAVAVYAGTGLPWWLPLALFLVPDLSAAGLVAGPRAFAWSYDLAHAAVLPGALVGLGVLVDSPVLTALAAVWLLHIGVDRVLGYGLRHPHDPDLTHLGRKGRRG